MKKLGLIFFLSCLIGVCITGNQCARKPIAPSTIDTGNTIVNQPKDTSGETLYVTCQDGITASAKTIEHCVVYLLNNTEDYFAWQNNQTLPPAARLQTRVVTKDSAGKCIFFKVRPPSNQFKNVAYPGHSGGYQYYMVGYKLDFPNPGDTDKVTLDLGQVYTGGSGSNLGGEVLVQINNNKLHPHQVEMIYP